MSLLTLLKEKNMTMYRLSKITNIPQPTISDIFTGKTKIENCKAITVYRIAKVLGCSVEDLISDSLQEHSIPHRTSFDVFKSEVCHRVRSLGDVEFLIQQLKSNSIREYYKRKWYPECLYLLAMIDYLCRINGIPLDEEYDDLRKMKLSHTIYPTGILLEANVLNDEHIKEQAIKNAIPEFLAFNIVESEIRDVV